MAHVLEDLARECRRLGEISRLARGFGLSRRLGQHFMVSCRLAIEVATRLGDLCPGGDCLVYELGSGLGSLTLFLEKCSSYVVTSEIDPRFVEVLRRTFLGGPVDIVASDGIPLIRSLGENFVVVSNTPYVVSSKVVVTVVKSAVRGAVLVLQDEVAKKLAAKPGDPNYGRITAFTGTFMEVELGGRYPPASFRPKPRVWSTVVVLRRKRKWLEELGGYEDFLRCLFNQRRRSLSKRLRECAGKDLEGIAPGLRVFSADPEFLFRLYMALRQGGERGSK